MNMGRRGLPAVYAVCADLEQLAYQADAELSEKNLKVKYLEEAARTINGVFSKCLNDRSASQQSRRWGTYKVMCMLFKIYFRLGNMHLCVSLTKVLKMQQDFPSLDRFPMAHQVTFRYYQGILDFFDEKYKDAEANLSFAFEHCPKKARKNKYLALVYLIPTRLLRGSLPEPWLLKRYPPIERVYGPLVNALRIGDLKSFDEELAKHELDLTAKGTYLTVERSRFLCIRNLFRKV